MSKSSETYFKIPNQPVDFCPLIDDYIEKFNKYMDAMEEIYQLENENDIKKYNMYLAEDKPTYDIHLFDDLILGMENWFKGWQNLFDIEISKEKNPLFQNQIRSEYFFFESQLASYKNRVEYFKIMFKEHIEYLSSLINDLEKSISYGKDEESKAKLFEECFHYLNSGISLTSEFIDNLEYLRFSNDYFRRQINDELKKMTKIQLIRNKDSKWDTLISESENWHMINDLKYLAKDKYVLKTNRERY